MQLKSVESVKDLGNNYDLSWGKHVSYVVNKANKKCMLGVIKRLLGSDSRYAFSCFKSLVRPILEYVTLPPSGAPTKKKDTESLEKVQRRASRLALKGKARRNELWRPKTLEKRRELLSLVQCYKIIFRIDSLVLFRTFLNLLSVIELEPITIISFNVKVSMRNC